MPNKTILNKALQRTFIKNTLKKEIKFYLLIIFMLLLIACRKENIKDGYILNKMEFHNSSLKALSNITIVGYKQGGKFTKIVDDTYYITNFKKIETKYDVYYEGDLNKDLRTDLDYKISFISLGQTCEITEIKVRKFGNFIDGYSKSFDGYKVNGLNFGCQIIKVFPK